MYREEGGGRATEVSQPPAQLRRLGGHEDTARIPGGSSKVDRGSYREGKNRSPTISSTAPDMLTSDDRKEVDLHLQRGSIARGVFHDILELVIFKICHNSMMLGGGGGVA